METAFYRSRLRDELSQRTEKNSRYSLRAFARSLKFEPTVISQIISGKRIPSVKSAERLMQSLGLSPDEQELFLSSLAEVHRKRTLKRSSPFFRRYKGRTPPTKELSIDLFRVIADWYHYAILALTMTEEFKSEPKWIASRLGITETEANLAVQRLMNVGLLKEEEGLLHCSQEGFTTADKKMTTAALRRHQKQILEKAIHSLENDPIETRSHTSMTMAIDPEKLPEAKRRIEAFTQDLSSFLESGRKRSVYEIGIALFPLEREGV